MFKEVELERLDAVARESIRANRHSAQKARAKPAARAGEQGEVMGGEGWQLAARAQRGREFELWCRAHLASAWRLLLSRYRHASRPRFVSRTHGAASINLHQPAARLLVSLFPLNLSFASQLSSPAAPRPRARRCSASLCSNERGARELLSREARRAWELFVARADLSDRADFDFEVIGVGRSCARDTPPAMCAVNKGQLVADLRAAQVE